MNLETAWVDESAVLTDEQLDYIASKQRDDEPVNRAGRRFAINRTPVLRRERRHARAILARMQPPLMVVPRSR